MPELIQKEIRLKIREGCELHDTAPEDILEYYRDFNWMLHTAPNIAKYGILVSAQIRHTQNIQLLSCLHFCYASIGTKRVTQPMKTWGSL